MGEDFPRPFSSVKAGPRERPVGSAVATDAQCGGRPRIVSPRSSGLDQLGPNGVAGGQPADSSRAIRFIRTAAGTSASSTRAPPPRPDPATSGLDQDSSHGLGGSRESGPGHPSPARVPPISRDKPHGPVRSAVGPASPAETGGGERTSS
jgi:hypothetical protein